MARPTASCPPCCPSSAAAARAPGWRHGRYEPKRGEFETHTRVEPRKYPELTLRPGAALKQEVDIFYKRFSKEVRRRCTLLLGAGTLPRTTGRLYLQRSTACSPSAPPPGGRGATVWIDYNLWMVPAYLREFRPDLVIGFFHHTYFPSADVFNVLPWRREIVGSLLQCDYGFPHPAPGRELRRGARRGVGQGARDEELRPTFRTYGCAVGLEEMTTAIGCMDGASASARASGGPRRPRGSPRWRSRKRRAPHESCATNSRASA